LSLATALGAILITFGPLPPYGPLSWLGLMMVVALMRALDWLAQNRLPADVDRRPRRWLMRYGACTIATALAWNVFTFCFYPHLDAGGRIATAIIYAAMAVGSVALLAASRLLGPIYVLMLLLPLSALTMAAGGTVNLTLGIVGVVYALGAASAAVLAHRSLARAMLLARENEALLRQAQHSSAEARHLNQELSAARNDLLQANQGLETRIRERTEELQREVAERHSYQQELEHLASHDPLTKLANRSHFGASVEAAIAEAQRSGNRMAVYFVDLDRFKQVNDGLGHLTGDQVLRIAGERLREVVRPGTLVARWGGDEFVVLDPSIDSLSSVMKAGAAIVAAMKRPIDVDSGAILISASVGVALYPEHGDYAARLVEHADLAVFQAKKSGRGTARIYQKEWGAAARERMAMAQAMRQAIENNELHLYFQPIVSTVARKVVCMEALCRWTHIEWGSVPPASFIPLAEESGLMPLLGKWVLRRACESAQALYPNADGPRVAVNVSVPQLLEDSFLADVEWTLTRSGLPPQRLVIEVTESLFAEDSAQIGGVLQGLRRLGVRVSIDDFGTGYSSMGYLRRMPIDELKIDGSFVRDLDAGGESIIRAVKSMSDSLGLEVVVEGIETREQLTRLLALGVERMQGFWIAPPVPPEDAFSDFAGNWNPKVLAPFLPPQQAQHQTQPERQSPPLPVEALLAQSQAAPGVPH
jgi:diguanylate cyclase (GGDEF)-like protein